MTRRMLLLGSVAVLALIGASWLVQPLPPPITEERIARIKPGMTRSEIVALLGPPRDESGGDEESIVLGLQPPRWTPPSTNCSYWCGAKAGVTVYFDDNDRAITWLPAWPLEVRETILERIRRWLHL